MIIAIPFLICQCAYSLNACMTWRTAFSGRIWKLKQKVSSKKEGGVCEVFPRTFVWFHMQNAARNQTKRFLKSTKWTLFSVVVARNIRSFIVYKAKILFLARPKWNFVYLIWSTCTYTAVSKFFFLKGRDLFVHGYILRVFFFGYVLACFSSFCLSF